MSEPTKVSKTTITFTVFHRTDDNPFTGVEETWGEYDHPFDGPLGLAMQEAWDGSMVGMESEPVTVPVPEEQLEAALQAIGNDGEFFNDDEIEEA